MISVLIYIIITCVLLGLLYWVTTMIPLPPPFAQIVQVCIVVIGVLIVVVLLLSLVGVGPGIGHAPVPRL